MNKTSSNLCLRESQRCRELGSLWKREVLRVLKPSLESRELETGVDGAGLPDFLGFSVDHPHFGLGCFFF